MNMDSNFSGSIDRDLDDFSRRETVREGSFGGSGGIGHDLQRSRMLRQRKRQAFQQELQNSLEVSIRQSFSRIHKSGIRGGRGLNSILEERMPNQRADLGEPPELNFDDNPIRSKQSQNQSILKKKLETSTSLNPTGLHSIMDMDEAPDLILDDDDRKASKNKQQKAMPLPKPLPKPLDARRETGTVEEEPEDMQMHEVPISMPGVIQPGLMKARSHNQAVRQSKDLASIRGSICIRKVDLQNVSTDMLNPKLSINGKTINKVTMKLPIFKIMQAQVIEQYQQQGLVRNDGTPLVALKLNKVSKRASIDNLYTVTTVYDGKGGSGVKYLQDRKNKKAVKTIGKEPFPFKIELFDDEQVHAKDRNINEQVFEQLKLEESIWDCCHNGKNMTVFALEDKGKKGGLSTSLHGRSRQINNDELQSDSERRPGMIRMTVEAIFAHIFLNRGSEFVLRMTFLEINNEFIYDLLTEGQQLRSHEEAQEINCLNIEQTMQMYAKGLANRLQNLLGGEGGGVGRKKDNTFFQESTLILKFTLENLPREKVADYEMMMDEEDLAQIRVSKSQIAFVDLPELFKQENIQDQINKLRQLENRKDPSLYAIDHFITSNMEIRIGSDESKKSGADAQNLTVDAKRAKSPSKSSNQNTLGSKLQSIEKYQISKILNSQLLQGNSKMIYMFSMCPEQTHENVSMLIQMATEAALGNQTQVKTNEMTPENSQLIKLKDEIEQKERQIQSIDFQIKIIQERQARGASSQFKTKRSLTPRLNKGNDLNSSPTYQKRDTISSKPQEEMEQQQKRIQKLKLMNQIASLKKQILSQDSVAKFMKQFEVNQGTRRITKILTAANRSGVATSNTATEKSLSSGPDQYSAVRKSTYVDRMSRRLVHAKAFLDEDTKTRIGLPNTSDINASGMLDFQQQKTQQGIQEKISQFVRMSLKAANKSLEASQIHEKVRQSVRESLRMSIAAKNQVKQRVDENLKKLDLGLGMKVNELRGRRGARAYEVLQEVPKAKEEDSEKDKSESFLFGNMSYFDQNLSVVEAKKDLPFTSPNIKMPNYGEDQVEILKESDLVDRASGFLSDHLEENDRHVAQQKDPRLEQSVNINALDAADDNLLNDKDLDAYIQNNMDAFQDIEIENIRFDGDMLDVDVALKIDIPDLLNDELQLSVLHKQQLPIKTESSPADPNSQRSLTPRKFKSSNPQRIQASKMNQQITNLSSNLARTVLKAKEKMYQQENKPQEMENDISLQGIYKSPSLYQTKESKTEKDVDVTEKFLMDEDSFSDDLNDDSDSEQEPQKTEEANESQPSFDISLRNDDEDPEENPMGVRQFIAMQRQNYGKNAFRGTIINEAEEDEEEDSFEIKREIKKQKDFEQYSTQLDQIQKKVEQHTSLQKQKMRESIKQLSQLRQKANLLHQRKLSEQQKKATSGANSSTAMGSSGSQRGVPDRKDTFRSLQQDDQFDRKESYKIEDRFLRAESQRSVQQDDQFYRKESNRVDDRFLRASSDAFDDKLNIMQDDPLANLNDASLPDDDDDFPLLRNEFDLNNLDEKDLLREMADIENIAKQTMEELVREQEQFERDAQRQMQNTMKRIRYSIKSSIRQSRATISKRRDQRETMKRLQSESAAGGRFGAGGPSGLSNQKCGNCDKYLETIEKYETELEQLQQELTFLKMQKMK